MPVLLRVYALLPESRIWKFFGSLLVRKNCYRNMTNPTLRSRRRAWPPPLAAKCIRLRDSSAAGLPVFKAQFRPISRRSCSWQKPAVCHAYSWREAERR